MTANPAPAVVDVVRRLRLRLRRMKGGEPATEHPPLPAVDHKRHLIYYDKARWPRRDYEDKGVQPHG